MAASPSVLGKVLDVFERNFRDRGEIGASVSIWWDGEELISEGRGWCEREKRRPWTTATMVPVYSATKGPASATLLLALENRGLSAATPVREVWPAFPVKDAQFLHLLSHQCGLPVLDRVADAFDHAAVVEAIEHQQPAWTPGTGHGYHPRSFGALVGEPVRRLTGKPLGQVWRETIADPLEIEFWIGLPEREFPRVAQLYPGRTGKADREEDFYLQYNTTGSFVRRAFSSPRGLQSVQGMNDPRTWAAGLPAICGIGTASGLAKFYQAAIGAMESPLSPAIRHALATLQVSGPDRVLLRPTAFTCGMQMDPLDAQSRKIRQIYGPSKLAFGHPGAGGSHGLGDPASAISFAYVMNQMDLSVMPGVKCLEMVDALFSEI